MIVNNREIETIISIISLEWEIFSNVSKKFKRKFPARRRFDFATILIFLISNNTYQASKLKESINEYYLNLYQRLFGYFILFDLYSNEGIADSPFLAFFISVIELNPLGGGNVPLQKQIEGYFCLNLIFSFQTETVH